MLSFTSHEVDMVTRLLTATFLGALVGLERGVHGKDAGFKTYALVCLGSALMMIISVDIYAIYKGIAVVDPSRIAAQVVTGVGFLGAGAIIRSQQGSVKGLTTAAGIWAICGVGLACGIGLFKEAIVATLLVLVVLVLFSKVERRTIRSKKESEA
ncbi:MAG: MgtC/SapB family protein [Candidatus Omnitrophica bacterium]|nr:MgtC/SapB family protein [Candidatus Omnitrophota bacterium]